MIKKVAYLLFAISVIFSSMTLLIGQSCNNSREIMNKLASSPGPRIYLLSYPRSGNTWMRYCIEVLTQQPTVEYNVEAKPVSMPLGCTCGHALDFSKAPIWKVHNIQQLNFTGRQHNPKSDTLIFIARNPKEAIIRHIGNFNPNRLFAGEALRKFRLYFDAFNIYDNWKGEKILIYYEDMIRDPQKVLLELIDFLGDSTQGFDLFFSEYEKHKATALKFYDLLGGSQTQGDDLFYYSRKIGPQVCRKIDEWINKFYPGIWGKYLKDRFSEDALQAL